MYIITFGIVETRIQWNCEFGFKSREKAEEYLAENNFLKSGLYYEKEYDGWFPKTNAMISRIKLI